MSLQNWRVALIRLLGACGLLLAASQVLALGNWENGNTQYHTICTNCHNADTTLPAGPADAYPAVSTNGSSFVYLKGRFNAGVVGTQMGAPHTNGLRSPGGDDLVSDIAAYIAKPIYPHADPLSPLSAPFGPVGIGRAPTITFTVSNSTGTDLLNVSDAVVYRNGIPEVNSPYSVGITSCTNIPTSASPCRITVTFTPGSIGVLANRELRVFHDALGGVLTAVISGEGKAALTVAPQTLTYPSAVVPTNLQQTRITDYVGDPIRICRTDTPEPPAVASPLSSPADYTLDAPYTLGSNGIANCYTTGTTNTFPRLIDLPVRFSMAAGPRNANLSIYRVDGAGNPLGVKFPVLLLGNPGPVLKVNESSLFDAAVPPDPGVEVDNDHVLDRQVTIQSRGTVPVAFTPSSFVISGANKDEYTLTGGGCQSLAGLAAFTSAVPDSCQLNLRFNPSDVGLRTPATLTIQVAGVPDNFVPLNGTGFRGPRLTAQQGGLPLASGALIQFGTQTQGGLYAAKTITLNNGGTLGDLEVALPAAGAVPGFSFTASAGCGNLKPLPPYTPPPATVCTIDLQFAPTAVQAYASAVPIQTRPAGSAAAFSVFTLNLQGQGSANAVPVLRWTDASGTTITRLDFPDTDAGAPATGKIRLYNAGPGGAILQLANVVGLDAPNFSLDTTDCSTGRNLYEGTSCELPVKFAPGTAGLKTASIQLSAIGSTPPTLIVPPLLVASGKGIASGSTASLGLSSTALGFPDTTVGAVGLPQELTLSNKGSQTLHVLSMAVTVPFAVQGKTCAPAPFDLPPGAECTLTVSFSPQAEGHLTGTLQMTTDGTPATQSVALSANAQAGANVSSGGGCSIASGDSLLDPTLWAMALLALMVLVLRRRER